MLIKFRSLVILYYKLYEKSFIKLFYVFNVKVPFSLQLNRDLLIFKSDVTKVSVREGKSSNIGVEGSEVHRLKVERRAGGDSRATYNCKV